MTGRAPFVTLGPARSQSTGTPSREPVFGSVFAVLLCLCIAAVSVVPVGVSGLDAAFVPHPALAFVFALSAQPTTRLGPVGVFLIGLAVDVLTVSPLGICAATYLLVHAAARHEVDGLSRLPGPVRFVVFALLAALVVGAHGLAVMALGESRPHPETLAASLAVTALIYPLAAWLVGSERADGGRGKPGRSRPFIRRPGT